MMEFEQFKSIVYNENSLKQLLKSMLFLIGYERLELTLEMAYMEYKTELE